MELSTKIFYHYTSIPALYEIVKNKSLLLSGVESLNDIEEASYSITDFEKDFRTLYETKNDKFINYLYENAFVPKLKEFEELARPDIEPFVFSLSTEYDNLAHWDRYADSKKGVCIGIDVTKLQTIQFIASGFVQISPIIYDEESRLEYFWKNLADKLIGHKTFPIFPEIPQDLFYKDMGYTLISDSYRQMKYFVKNTAWKDEGEIRLAYEDTLAKDTFSKIPHLQEVYKNFTFPDMNSLFKQSGLDVLEFKLINNKIRPCRFLDISPVWGEGLITEVMLGPKCEQSKKDLELFLKASGLNDAQVTESRIKIR